MTFRIGQRVCCIARFDRRSLGVDGACVTFPEVGKVYTVRGFSPLRSGIVLEEIVNPYIPSLLGPQEPSFVVSCFRPVVDRKFDLSVFTRLLDTERAPA